MNLINIIAKKSLGQHFLNNEYTLSKIIQLSNITNNDYVIEIGPGLGALTNKILSITKYVQIIEIDNKFLLSLTSLSSDNKPIIYFKNVLNFNFDQFFIKKKIKIIGNVPYNISTPILFHLIKYRNYFKDIHLLLQKEVVDRIISQPSKKTYGRLSIMLQLHFKCESLLNIPSTVFIPKPKVESKLLRLIPYQTSLNNLQHYLLFYNIVKITFHMRRKKLKNSLNTIIDDQIINDLPIDKHLRPENLSLKDFIILSNYIYNIYKKNNLCLPI